MKYISLILLCLSFAALSQNNTVGLLHNEEASFNGYTLFSPSADTTSYLIDNCGRVLNTWKGKGRPGRTAILREDGLLLRCEQIGLPDNAFWGGGSGGRLMLIDWNDDIVWQYDYSSANYFHHHEVASLPNGNILVIAWDAYGEEASLESGRNPAFFTGEIWSEKIVELKPIGSDDAEVVWEWKLWDHLVQDFDPSKSNFANVAEHPEHVDLNFIDLEGAGPGGGGGLVDWVHINAIDYNEELDQIVVSSRNFSEIWVIDHSTTTEEAAGHSGGNSGKGGDLLYRWGNPQSYKRGSEFDRFFYKQHNSRWIKDLETGAHQISVFNNGLFREPTDYSSVDIVTLPLNGNEYEEDEIGPFLPPASTVFYGNPDTEFIFSLRISSAQQLPNGNFLIDIGQEGRFIEVNDSGNIVWEYQNPVGAFGPLNQGEEPNGAAVFNIERYAVDYPAFDGLNLFASGFIEGNPSPTSCQIVPEPSVGITNVFSEILIYPNPVKDFLNVQLNDGAERVLKVVDVNGRVHVDSKIAESLKLNISELQKGIYFILIDNGGAGSFVKQ